MEICQSENVGTMHLVRDIFKKIVQVKEDFQLYNCCTQDSFVSGAPEIQNFRD